MKFTRFPTSRGQFLNCAIILLCIVTFGLPKGRIGTAQGNRGNYDCLHLLSLTSPSDWVFDLERDVVLPAPRLPGLTHHLSKSFDGDWFAFETAMTSRFSGSSELASLLLTPNAPSIYVGPMRNGEVHFTADNPIGFIQTHVVPTSLTWSPKKAQLAYLYANQSNRVDGDTFYRQPRVSLAIFDIGTKSRREAEIQFPNVIGVRPLLEWSSDGKFLAVMVLIGDSGDRGIAIYDTADLKLLSSITTPKPEQNIGPLSIKWMSQGNRLAIYWADDDQRSGSITLVKPGEESRHFVSDESLLVSGGLPIWSPDGRYLVLYGNQHATFLYLAEAVDNPVSSESTVVRSYDLGELDYFSPWTVHWISDSQSLLLTKRIKKENYGRPSRLVVFHPTTQTFEIIIDNVLYFYDPLDYFPPHVSGRFDIDFPQRPVVVTYNADGQSGVDLLNLDTLEHHHLITAKTSANASIQYVMTWSPDLANYLIVEIKSTNAGNDQSIYWGTADGKSFRQLDHPVLRTNIIDTSTDGAGKNDRLWFDGAYFAYVAVPQSQGPATLKKVILANRSTGAVSIIADNLSDASIPGHQEAAKLFFSSAEGQGDETPKIFFNGFDLGGRRLFRYPLTVWQSITPVEVFPSHIGKGAAYLVDYPPSSVGKVFLPKGLQLELVEPTIKPDPYAANDESLSPYSGYTGVVWSPDGKYFAAYEAVTFPLGDSYGHANTPSFIRIDIYTAAGTQFATVPIRGLAFNGNPTIAAIGWQHCTDAFPDPYQPADLMYGYFPLPPG